MIRACTTNVVTEKLQENYSFTTAVFAAPEAP